jgi:hypothetical protein
MHQGRRNTYVGRRVQQSRKQQAGGKSEVAKGLQKTTCERPGAQKIVNR